MEIKEMINQLLNGYHLTNQELEMLKPTIQNILKDINKRLEITE